MGDLSGVEAEASRASSAGVAPSHFPAYPGSGHAQLAVSNVNRGADQHTDFQGFLASRYAFRDSATATSWTSKQPATDSSSMAASRRSSGTTVRTSACVPSLGYFSSIPSDQVTHSSRRDSTTFEEHDVNSEESDGATTPSSQSSEAEVELPCCFSFLACKLTFNDLAQWDTHCESHFRGQLPECIACPFTDCGWSVSAATGRCAWGARFAHIASLHRADSVIDVSGRPDADLVRHLWRAQLINNAQMKEIRRFGRIVGSDQFLRRGGAKQDQRRERTRGECRRA